MGRIVQTLKDSSYRILGYIEEESNGTLVIKDSSYRVLGYYFPGENCTKRSDYSIVGHGNLLTTLL